MIEILKYPSGETQRVISNNVNHSVPYFSGKAAEWPRSRRCLYACCVHVNCRDDGFYGDEIKVGNLNMSNADVRAQGQYSDAIKEAPEAWTSFIAAKPDADVKDIAYREGSPRAEWQTLEALVAPKPWVKR